MSASLIQPVQGNGQSVETFSQFPVPLQVKVTTGVLVPVANEIVQWNVPQSGPSGHFAGDSLIYAPVYSVTNGQGIATAPNLRANENAGNWQVLVIPQSNINLNAAFNCTNTITNLTPILTSIIVTGGNNQTIANNSTSAPITATYYDQFGKPLVGVAAKAVTDPITPLFTMVSGSFTATGVTDSLGQFSCTVKTLNPATNEGPVPFNVNFSDNVPIPVIFGIADVSVINPAIATKIIVVSGSNQIANVSTTFSAPLVVQVVNGVNGPLTGIVARFTAPGSGASCTPVTQDRTTVAGGTATTGSLVANATVGAYVVTVTLPSVTPVVAAVTFVMTNASISGPTADHNLIFCEA